VTQARAARVLVTTAAVSTACVLPAFLVGAMAVQLRADLGVSASGTGVAVGAFFAAASLASAPLGRLTERRGATRSLRAAAVIAAACQLGPAGLARSLPVLLAFLAVGGSANALAQPAANLLLARDLPVHRHPTVSAMAVGVRGVCRPRDRVDHHRAAQAFDRHPTRVTAIARPVG
jgi:MFS family permease